MLIQRTAPAVRKVDLARADVELSLSHSARMSRIVPLPELDVIEIDIPDGDTFTAMISVPLGAAVGYWHPDAMRDRTIQPDWAGEATTSLIRSAPLGILYDSTGRSLLAFGLDRLVGEVSLSFGVDEEEKRFVVVLQIEEGVDRVSVSLVRGALAISDAIRRITAWMDRTVGMAPLAIPEFSTHPVYSTWYAHGQAISQELLEGEGALAVDLGMRTIIIDDGWQRFGTGRFYSGCGDWIPDDEKFPGFREHVQTLKSMGLRVVLWVAPLLIGARSESFAQLSSLAPATNAFLECNVLDPRRADVRQHMVDACLRLMVDFDLDGLKIDFLDEAMIYAGTLAVEADENDVGIAMSRFLGQLRSALDQAGFREPLIEFRQPYVSPAITPSANVLRAADCPADAVLNRTGIADARLISAHQVVHSDPVVWDPTGGVHAVATQMMGAFFGVPQISVRLRALPTGQRESLKQFLARWSSLREVILLGRFTTESPHLFFPQLRTELDEHLVVGLYERGVIDVDPSRSKTIVVLNGSSRGDIVLDFAGDTVSRLRIGTSGPAGGDHGDHELEAAPGLLRVDVPAGGIAVIEIRP